MTVRELEQHVRCLVAFVDKLPTEKKEPAILFAILNLVESLNNELLKLGLLEIAKSLIMSKAVAKNGDPVADPSFYIH